MDALTIASSAMQAQATNISVIANNIANSDTPGYTPQQATLIPMNPGVAVGPIIASVQGAVDDTTQIVDLMAAKQAYEAAASVANSDEQMFKTMMQSV
jgi:flagellar basal body rod protein FlgG